MICGGRERTTPVRSRYARFVEGEWSTGGSTDCVANGRSATAAANEACRRCAIDFLHDLQTGPLSSLPGAN